ncbi:MAG: FHA domain-containing protein [Planctomycetia bacterium]
MAPPTTLNVQLTVQRGHTTTKMISLRRIPAVIGRQQECDLRVVSKLVSRRHCSLEDHGGRLIVRDLGSVNGTMVNGKRVVDQSLLNPGDELEVGPLTFIVDYELAEPDGMVVLPAEDADEGPDLGFTPLSDEFDGPTIPVASTDDDPFQTMLRSPGAADEPTLDELFESYRDKPTDSAPGKKETSSFDEPAGLLADLDKYS